MHQAGAAISHIYASGLHKKPKGRSKIESKISINDLGLCLQELFAWIVLDGMKPKEKLSLTDPNEISLYTRQAYAYKKKFPKAEFYYHPHKAPQDPTNRYTVKMGNKRVKSVVRQGIVLGLDIYRLS